MVFGWLIPALFVMTVAASLAELTSAMPYVALIPCADASGHGCTLNILSSAILAT